MASVENSESNILSFGPIKRDSKTHVPYCSSKIGIRGDLMTSFWDIIKLKVEADDFKHIQFNERLARVTGGARMNVPIRGKCFN